MKSAARKPRWFWPAVTTAAVIAVAIGYGVGTLTTSSSPRVVETAHATVLEPARAVEPFDLIDHDGEPFTAERFKGGWTFVFFGFTHCPDICPATMAVLGDVLERMTSAAADTGGVSVAFVTVDPQRDTPRQLAQYVPFFHPEFIGVTGDEDELARFARQLGAVFMRTELPDSDDYTMDHSSGLLLIDPDGAFRAYFSAPHDGDTVASDFERIVGPS